ncbi:MAG TPA: stimulus-sensing domain-containing protein, partial [Sphingomicrobium sp.]|nr:stimulus-sensing domain-containing protein [Sphingomicrobium sp.]
MASAIDSTNNDEADLRLKWSRRWTLAHRILALNLITVLLVALSTLYLDVFRNRLSAERTTQVRIEATATALAMEAASSQDKEAVLASVSRSTGSRLRLFGLDGKLIADSWHLTGPTYELVDPSTQKWTKDAARALDRGFNVLVGARSLDDYVEPAVDNLQAWPEAVRAQSTGEPATLVRNAPDLTPVISAAVPTKGAILLATKNDRTFTHTVRRQRAAIAAAMAFLVAISVFLSLFLARTIVRPLRRLA